MPNVIKGSLWKYPRSEAKERELNAILDSRLGPVTKKGKKQTNRKPIKNITGSTEKTGV